MTCRRQSNRGWWGYRSSSWSGQWRNQGSHWSMPLRSVIVTYFASCQIICTSTRHWSSCIISDHLCVTSVINCLASCQSICTNKHHNLQDVLMQMRSWHFLFIFLCTFWSLKGVTWWMTKISSAFYESEWPPVIIFDCVACWICIVSHILARLFRCLCW